MDESFWIDRWQRKQIGFHQSEANALLQTWWPQFFTNKNEPVFVPLCGKSRDLLWLRAQGHPVCAVELSPIAVQEFFSENQLLPQIERNASGKLHSWQCDYLQLWQGNFFDVTAEDLANVRAIYDRAALIALPLAMRAAYVQHMQQIAPAAQILLLTLEYAPEELVDAPPFSVTESEVHHLFATHYHITRLAADDVLARPENARFKNAGISRLEEKAYLLRAHL